MYDFKKERREKSGEVKTREGRIMIERMVSEHAKSPGKHHEHPYTDPGVDSCWEWKEEKEKSEAI